MSSDIIKQERASAATRSFHEHRCKLVNRHSSEVRVYFVRWDWIEEVHVLRPREEREVFLKEGQAAMVAFDVDAKRFLCGRLLDIHGPQTIEVCP